MNESRDSGFNAGVNPFLSDDPAAFQSLIEAVDPASLLVVIEDRLGAALRSTLEPEDILQEALLRVWRGRSGIEWRGLRSFRTWLLTVIDNRIRDAADEVGAQKRGDGHRPVLFSALEPEGSSDGDRRAEENLVASTTPSRIAIYREQAAAMRSAVESLPDDLRDVVRLRLFDKLSLDDVAARLGIGEPAARHRFRKGAALYQQRLKAVFASRSGSAVSGKSAAPEPRESAPP